MKVVNISAHPKFVQQRDPIQVQVPSRNVGRNNSAIRLLDCNDLYNVDLDLIGRFKNIVINNFGNSPGQILEWNDYIGQVMERRDGGKYTFLVRKDNWNNWRNYG